MLKNFDVVAAIIESEGKILLARRPENGDQPGLWEFPGGKVEAGETQPAALARELLEELGITAQIGGRGEGIIKRCRRVTPNQLAVAMGGRFTAKG